MHSKHFQFSQYSIFVAAVLPKFRLTQRVQKELGQLKKEIVAILFTEGQFILLSPGQSYIKSFYRITLYFYSITHLSEAQISNSPPWAHQPQNSNDPSSSLVHSPSK